MSISNSGKQIDDKWRHYSPGESVASKAANLCDESDYGSRASRKVARYSCSPSEAMARSTASSLATEPMSAQKVASLRCAWINSPVPARRT